MDRDRMLALQDQAGRRPGRAAPSAHHLRPRPGQPAPLQQVRQGGRRPAATLLQLAPRSPPSAIRRPDTMCNLYSITTNQAAISALFRVVNRYVGNLAPMPGVFPDYKAPIVRTGADGRELATARWGMPSSAHALMEATKKRAEKLEAKGKPVDFKELLRMEPDGGTTNIRNVKSKHWTTLARRRDTAAWCRSTASASSTRPKAATSGSRSTRPARWPASPASGPTGLRSGRSRRARPPTTSSRS